MLIKYVRRYCCETVMRRRKMARVTCGKYNRKDRQDEQEGKNWTSLEERHSLV